MNNWNWDISSKCTWVGGQLKYTLNFPWLSQSQKSSPDRPKPTWVKSSVWGTCLDESNKWCIAYMARTMEFLVVCTLSSPRGQFLAPMQSAGATYTAVGETEGESRNQSSSGSCKGWSPKSPWYGLANHKQAPLLADLPKLLNTGPIYSPQDRTVSSDTRCQGKESDCSLPS